MSQSFSCFKVGKYDSRLYVQVNIYRFLSLQVTNILTWLSSHLHASPSALKDIHVESQLSCGLYTFFQNFWKKPNIPSNGLTVFTRTLVVMITWNSKYIRTAFIFEYQLVLLGSRFLRLIKQSHHNETKLVQLTETSSRAITAVKSKPVQQLLSPVWTCSCENISVLTL